MYPDIDETGRRYRRMGDGSIEYEPEIIIDGIAVPQSQLSEFNRKRKEQIENTLHDVNEQELHRAMIKDCPFSKNQLNTNCSEACAWYDGGCVLTRLEGSQSPGYHLDGKCPVSGRKCTHNCNMRVNDRCILLEGRIKR